MTREPGRAPPRHAHGSSAHGIFQARVLECDSPDESGMQTRDPCRPWRATLDPGHKPRLGLLCPAVTLASKSSCSPPPGGQEREGKLGRVGGGENDATRSPSQRRAARCHTTPLVQATAYAPPQRPPRATSGGDPAQQRWPTLAPASVARAGCMTRVSWVTQRRRLLWPDT